MLKVLLLVSSAHAMVQLTIWLVGCSLALPAPKNLMIPPYMFTDNDTMLFIGADEGTA